MDVGTYKQVSYDADTAVGLNVTAGKFHSFWVKTCQAKNLSNSVAHNLVKFGVHLKEVIYVYRVSQEEWTKLRESVPYVELYRYNPKHLYPNLNGYGDNGHRKVWASGVSTYCTPSVTPYSSTAHARQRDTAR